MVDRCGCDECRHNLQELKAAFAEIQASPKLSKQLRYDAGLLVRIGTQEGADEAIKSFGFHLPKPSTRYPKLADALQRLSQHNSVLVTISHSTISDSSALSEPGLDTRVRMHTQVSPQPFHVSRVQEIHRTAKAGP
jgi:hypothetical protein